MNASSKPLLTACGATGDADGDKIATRIEVCFYNSNPNIIDTDGDAALDGAKDGCEVASLNGDRIVSSIDQGMLAQGISGSAGYTVNVDINKDGVLSLHRPGHHGELHRPLRPVPVADRIVRGRVRELGLCFDALYDFQTAALWPGGRSVTW